MDKKVNEMAWLNPPSNAFFFSDRLAFIFQTQMILLGTIDSLGRWSSISNDPICVQFFLGGLMGIERLIVLVDWLVCLLICRVDSEEDLYRLWVEGYQGNATDSLGSHNGYAFSTFDRDNDEAPVSRSPFSLFPFDTHDPHLRSDIHKFIIDSTQSRPPFFTQFSLILYRFDNSRAVLALRLTAEDGGSTGNQIHSSIPIDLIRLKLYCFLSNI